MELTKDYNILVLDWGNTLLKTALFQNHNILNVMRFETLHGDELNLFIDELEKEFGVTITYSIVSSVVPENEELFFLLKQRTQLLVLSHNTPLPINIHYRTPESLGKDRIAAVMGVSTLFPGKNVLVIDAGTCITFDFINSDKEYLGGAISPGINLRFKALHNFTGNLPLIQPIEKTNLIGDSTENSILSGIINGVREEIDGIINRYKSTYPDVKVIFTGGDIKYFEKYVKNNIFAVDNLVLKGLKDILLYNVKK
jgi:type III pantothenate kinase